MSRPPWNSTGKWFLEGRKALRKQKYIKKNQDAEEILAGYAQLFKDLERIEAENDAIASSCPELSLDVSLKKEVLRTPDEQSLVDEWNRVEEKRKETLVTAHEDFIRAIRDMAKRGGPVYPLDFSEGEPAEYPHLSDIRELARLLAKHAEVSVARGDTDEAVADIIAGLQLADALAIEPVLVSQLVRHAVTGIMFHAAQDSLPGEAIPSESLFDALMRQAANSVNQQACADAIRGDAVMGLHVYEDLRNGDETVLQGIFIGEDFGRIIAHGGDYNPDRFGLLQIKRYCMTKFYTSWLAHPWINRDEEAYVDGLSELANLALLPYYEALPAIRKMENEAPSSGFARIMIPAMARALNAQGRCEAQLELMRIGLTLERYYGEKGFYPDALSEIAPRLEGAVPADPFTGTSYIYRLNGNTFTLYSVGQDLQDDGGRHDFNDGDIVWRGQ